MTMRMAVDASGMGNKVSLHAYKLYVAAESKTVFIKNALIGKVQEWDAKWQSKQSKVSRLHVEWNSTTYFRL